MAPSLQDLKNAFLRYRDAELDLFEMICQSKESVLKQYNPWFSIESNRMEDLRKQYRRRSRAFTSDA